MNRPAFALALLFAASARAETFTVDTTSDAVLSACIDAMPADCTLRGAIDRANATAGGDTIAFDLAIGDSGYQAATQHWRFDAATALPAITDPLTIDGFTQAGAQPSNHAPGSAIAHTLKVELRGPNLNTDGLTAYAPLIVRGLVLNQWRRAIFQFNAGPHLVEGSYIGVDVSGQQAVPNGTGITLGGDTTVGGALPEHANVISANRDYGLNTQFALTRLRVHGNIIGARADLTGVPGRQDFGLYLLDARDTLIGGNTPELGNYISGSRFSGIHISAGSFQPAGVMPFARVQGNRIGVGLNERPLGNGVGNNYPQVLVSLGGYCRVEIGGIGSGEGNLIANGGNAGVAIGSCWGAPIVGNSFSGNRTLAIDLASSNGFDGTTANDPGDADAPGNDPIAAFGGNRFQNHPVLTLPPNFVTNGGGSSVALSYVVDTATSNASYPITVYFHRGGCKGGGRELLASDTYGASDAQQPRAFNLVADGNVLPLTAIAVDAAGNTSEFSPMIGDDLFADGLEDAPASFSTGQCP